jgi:hypothetical protein
VACLQPRLPDALPKSTFRADRGAGLARPALTRVSLRRAWSAGFFPLLLYAAIWAVLTWPALVVMVGR